MMLGIVLTVDMGEDIPTKEMRRDIQHAVSRALYEAVKANNLTYRYAWSESHIAEYIEPFPHSIKPSEEYKG